MQHGDCPGYLRIDIFLTTKFAGGRNRGDNLSLVAAGMEFDYSPGDVLYPRGLLKPYRKMLFHFKLLPEKNQPDKEQVDGQ